MNKIVKTVLIIAGGVIALYFIYLFWVTSFAMNMARSYSFIQTIMNNLA